MIINSGKSKRRDAETQPTESALLRDSTKRKKVNKEVQHKTKHDMMTADIESN